MQLVAVVPADASTNRKRKLAQHDAYFQAVADKYSELGTAKLASSSPPSPADLRCIVTSGDLIKETIDSIGGRQQDVEHTRERLRLEEALNQANAGSAVVTEGGSWGIMQFVTGLISTAPVAPAAPATPAAPAAPDDAGDVAAIITALAAPESSGASAAPLQGPAKRSGKREESIMVVKSELADQSNAAPPWHVIEWLARHLNVKYMNNTKGSTTRKTIIAEVLQQRPADVNAITVMPRAKKPK